MNPTPTPSSTPPPPASQQEATVLVRSRQLLGRDLDNAELRRIGARAVQRHRLLYRQEPSKVAETHPVLGTIYVFTYPGRACAILDEAIYTCLALDPKTYVAPPLPRTPSATQPDGLPF